MFWVGYFFLVKSIQVTFFDLCCLGFLFHHSDICTILYDLYVYLGKPKSPFGNPNPLQICVWVKGLREKVRQTTLVLRLFLLLLRVSPLCSSWLFIALPVSLDVFLVCPITQTQFIFPHHERPPPEALCVGCFRSAARLPVRSAQLHAVLHAADLGPRPQQRDRRHH